MQHRLGQNQGRLKDKVLKVLDKAIKIHFKNTGTSLKYFKQGDDIIIYILSKLQYQYEEGWVCIMERKDSWER